MNPVKRRLVKRILRPRVRTLRVARNKVSAASEIYGLARLHRTEKMFSNLKKGFRPSTESVDTGLERPHRNVDKRANAREDLNFIDSIESARRKYGLLKQENLAIKNKLRLKFR